MKTIWDIFRVLLLWLGILLCLFGCYNSKVAQRQVDKAILKEPQVAATELRKAFPCIILAKVDTVINNRDTTIYLECPDIIPDTLLLHDTTNITNTITNTKTIKVPVHLPVQTITVTKYVKDSAEGMIIVSQVQQINDLKLSDAKHKGSSDKWFWIAMGLLVIIGVGVYFKVVSFFK